MVAATKLPEMGLSSLVLPPPFPSTPTGCLASITGDHMLSEVRKPPSLLPPGWSILCMTDWWTLMAITASFSALSNRTHCC